MRLLSGVLVRVLSADTVVFQCDNKVVLQCILVEPFSDEQYRAALHCSIFNCVKCYMKLGSYSSDTRCHKDCELHGCVFECVASPKRSSYKEHKDNGCSHRFPV